ncbi:MAG: hypothetical protein ACXACY_03120 [Candidatus Hodarchaeales archaeon]|jgi:hypothetical protein
MIEVTENKYVLAGRTELGGTNSDIWMFQIAINDEFSTTDDPNSSTQASSGFFLLPVLAILGVFSHRRRKIS